MTPVSSASSRTAQTSGASPGVEFAGRNLPQEILDAVPVLAHHAHAAGAVHGDHGRGARMAHEVEVVFAAVPVAQPLGGDFDDAAASGCAWLAMTVGFCIGVLRSLGNHACRCDLDLAHAAPVDARSCADFTFASRFWIYVQSNRLMMKAKPTAFDSLNPSQRRAATFGTAVPGKGVNAGPLLILAGAGTGKTNTLAHRAAHLVLNGVDPARILMLTFTRRAAQEMIRRTQHIVARSAGGSRQGGRSQRGVAAVCGRVPFIRSATAYCACMPSIWGSIRTSRCWTARMRPT